MSTITAPRRAVIRHARRAAGQASALLSMIAGGQRSAGVTHLLAARGSLESVSIRPDELELEGGVADPADHPEIDGLLRSALGRGGYRWRAGPALRSPANEAFRVVLKGRTPS